MSRRVLGVCGAAASRSRPKVEQNSSRRRPAASRQWRRSNWQQRGITISLWRERTTMGTFSSTAKGTFQLRCNSLLALAGFILTPRRRFNHCDRLESDAVIAGIRFAVIMQILKDRLRNLLRKSRAMHDITRSSRQKMPAFEALRQHHRDGPLNMVYRVMTPHSQRRRDQVVHIPQRQTRLALGSHSH